MIGEKRIEFVDLTKGICIILVAMSHIGGPFDRMDSHNIIASFRMPLYFFISGIFFKSYEGLWGFVIRKLNKLIIPFIFFYVGAFLAKYIIWKVYPAAFQLPFEWSDILVIFRKHELIGFNPPIWFLIALFNCNVIFYIIHRRLREKNVMLMILLSLMIGVLGFLLGKLRIELPLYIDVAMTALPFYLGGFWIRRYNFFLYPHRFDKLAPAFILIALVAMYFIASRPGMRTNSYEGNIFQFYTAAFAGIFVIMLIGKRFKKAPVISYLGRYSVITLGVHAFILHFCQKIFPKFIHNEWILSIALLVVIISVSLLMTPVFLKIIPQFVAQKDFFPISKRIKKGEIITNCEKQEGDNNTIWPLKEKKGYVITTIDALNRMDEEEDRWGVKKAKREFEARKKAKEQKEKEKENRLMYNEELNNKIGNPADEIQ